MPTVPHRAFRVLLGGALTFWISCASPTPVSPRETSIGTWILSTDEKYAAGQLDLLQDGTCAYRIGGHEHACSWSPTAYGRFDLRYGRYWAINHAKGEVHGDQLTLDRAHDSWVGVAYRRGSKEDMGDLLYHRGKDLMAAGNVKMGMMNWKASASFGHLGAKNGVAWTLATSKSTTDIEARDALFLATSTVMETRNYQYLDTLAAAQARNRQYEQAVATEKEALSLLEKDTSLEASARDAAVGRFRHRIELYQSGQPYTER